MKTDLQIQKDVMDQLKWNPYLNSSTIGVAVKNGVVTLSGQVDNYAKKLEAEEDTKRVSGVKAIAEDIHVGISGIHQQTDTELAETILNVLKRNVVAPENKITIQVENGIVTLEGEVDWDIQRRAVKNAIAHLASVVYVVNNISLSQSIKPEDLEQQINAAIHRSATLDSNRIRAEVNGTKITLKGFVNSFGEKEDAERVAWAALGIVKVDNRLEIIPEQEFPG